MPLPLTPVIQLSADDRIASLERELFQLQGRRVEPQVRTRAQREADKVKLSRERSTSPAECAPDVEIDKEPTRPRRRSNAA